MLDGEERVGGGAGEIRGRPVGVADEALADTVVHYVVAFAEAELGDACLLMLPLPVAFSVQLTASPFVIPEVNGMSLLCFVGLFMASPITP